MESTSIHDLPNGSTTKNNVQFSINEMPVQPVPQQQQQQPINTNSLDQNTINQIISGLQQAGSATNLPSRDIPQNTETIITDAQVQPNYIPQASNKDYITEHEENDDIVNNYASKEKMSTSLDNLYDEIQLPLLIAILYFLFQLPIFKRMIFIYLPSLCSNDGNINIYGYVFNSILFGILYFFLVKVLSTFNKF
jgi:hypothetical protein